MEHSHIDELMLDFEEVRVRIVPLARTNYSYLIQDKASNALAVVDPGDADYLSHIAKTEFDQDISKMLITHKHWDHAAGVTALFDRYPEVQSYAYHCEKIEEVSVRVGDGDTIQLGSVVIRVLHTPGHTEGSVCFFVQQSKGPPLLFTGDTLFLGGMGAFFEGTAPTIMLTIEKLLSLPEDTLVFPGHEYADTTLRFGLLMEPTNEELRAKAEWVAMRRSKFYCTIPSTLSEERSYNPFLRIKTHSIMAATSTTYPIRTLIALQNNRIARRNEYKNLPLVREDEPI
jgi:hydroxyacylglutathione hydrolase